MNIKPASKVTIKDIARELGISPSTVTRALAGSSRIKAETVRRVRQKADAMGYVADSTARAMQSGTNALVGLLVPDIQNQFYATMARTVAKNCHRHGYQLVLSVTEDDPQVEEHHVRALVGARCAGVLIVPAAEITSISCRMLFDIPTVQLIRSSEDLSADGIGIDDRKAIYTATSYLLDLGHRRIGFLCGRSLLDTARARLQGFENAFIERGIPYDPELVQTGDPRTEHGREGALRLLSMRPCPTAILAGGAALTEGLLDAVNEQTDGALSNLSLLGFGDSAALRWWQGGGLTTLDLPISEMADAACARLFDRIGHPEDIHTKHTFSRFEAHIVLRGSTRSVTHPAG
jgi:LacI family transcriptional regulator